MLPIAGGMESDYSDSDLDIEFNVGPSSVKANDNSSRASIKTVTDNFSSKNANEVKNDNVHTSEKRDFRNRLDRMHRNSKNKCERNGRQSVNYRSTELYDDLRYAIMQGNVEVTKDILSKNIFVDVILKSGWTGLMHACSAGHHEIVSFLLDNKADPNYHKDMFTPLMAVCASKKKEEDLLKCCKLLLDHGAKVNARERHYTTPLMFSAREGHLQIVSELLNRGADLNMRDNRGNTALAWAAMCGHGLIVRALMERGADVSIINNMGQTAADLAYDNNHNEIASVLSKKYLIPNGDVAKSPHSPDGSEKLEIIYNTELKRTKGIKRIGELEMFLAGIDCHDLVSKFVEHKLTFHDLLIMNDEDLEKIGINKVGERKKILEACKAVHKKEWQNSSLPNLKQNSYITCPDAVAMMSNIAKHLKYISSSVVYVRTQIQARPRILELSQDSGNVHNLLDEVEDSLKNIKILYDEIRFLKMHLDKVQDNTQYIPADLIVEVIPSSTPRRKVLYTVIGISSVALLIGLVWKFPEKLLNKIQSISQMNSSS